jgi:hypothetical protein
LPFLDYTKVNVRLAMTADLELFFLLSDREFPVQRAPAVPLGALSPPPTAQVYQGRTLIFIFLYQQ